MSSHVCGSSGRRRRVAVVALVTALLPALPVTGRPAEATGGSTAATHAEAVKLAAVTGQRVEIQEKTTEISRTFAEADGTLTAELSNSPVRVRRCGGWVPTDATLEFRADGAVGPKASVSSISFSGGGDGPLVDFGVKDGSLSMRSPWRLPKPVLDGPRATYADVMSGVDLVMEAAVEGFTYNLVIKTRQAAADPALRSLRFPVSTAGLELRNDHLRRPEYVTPNGRLVLSVGAAVMWDSSASPAPNSEDLSSGQAVRNGPTAGARVAEMGLSGDLGGLTITPNAEMLTSPATVFPVVLDPAPTTVTRSAWAAAWQLYPSTSFYKTSHSLGVGYEGFEQHKIVRSYFQFDIGGFAQKKILDVKLRTYEVHSANCTPHSVSVSRVGPISPATTWNNQPVYQTEVTSKSFAHGYSSACPDAYEEFNVTNSVAYSTSLGSRTTTFRLRATDETNAMAWKQFSSFGELQIQYVSPPLPPTSVGVADPNVGCDGVPDPVNIADRTPKLRGVPRLSAADPGARVQVEFDIWGSTAHVTTARTTLNSPGVTHYLTLGIALADQQIYHFRARTIYPYPGGALGSGWSGWCWFRTDTTAPPPPTVTAKYGSTVLTNCSGATTCPEIVPFDEPISFTIKANAADVIRHTYRFQNNYGAGSIAGHTVTTSLEPPQEGWNTLFVRSYDEAGHYSAEAVFVVNIKSSSGPIGSWSFDDGSGTSAADGPGLTHPLTLAGGTAFDNDGRVAGSIQMDGVDDHAQASAPIVDTSKSFTASAWVRWTGSNESVIVAAPGAVASAFYLNYSASQQRWAFTRMRTDATNPTFYRALSNEPPLWGVWTHLTGRYDSAKQRVQLFVNGRLQQVAGDIAYPPDSGWKATGPLTVGRGKYNGANIASFPGSIDNVQVWQRALRDNEIPGLTDPRVNEIVQSGLTARWPLDSGYVSADQIWRTGETVYAANMPLSGFGTSADQSGAFIEDDERGRVLAMTGASPESLSIGRPVVDAGASFSVAVWVKLADTSRRIVLARQAGSDRDAWRLEFQPVDAATGRWVFARARADSTVEDVAVYPTDLDDPKTEWKLLIATYDAAAPSLTTGGPPGEIRLTVNNARWDGAEHSFTSPYRLGSTIVGKGRVSGSEMAGRMDELRLYAGVLDKSKVCQEFPDLGDQICPAS